MPDQRHAKMRETLPQGYQFLDARADDGADPSSLPVGDRETGQPFPSDAERPHLFIGDAEDWNIMQPWERH